MACDTAAEIVALSAEIFTSTVQVKAVSCPRGGPLGDRVFVVTGDPRHVYC